MGTETNSRSSRNQYCCQEKSLSDYTLRQGIPIMLDFFLSSLAWTWHTQTRAQVGDFSYQNKTRHSFLNINSQTAQSTGLWLQTNLLGTSSHEVKANRASAVKNHRPPAPQTKPPLILAQFLQQFLKSFFRSKHATDWKNHTQFEFCHTLTLWVIYFPTLLSKYLVTSAVLLTNPVGTKPNNKPRKKK